MKTTTLKVARRPMDKYTLIALFVSLVIYPVVYCSGIMSQIITPIFTHNSRRHWWYFWLANLAFHWIPFAAIWLALRKNGEDWHSLGLDWGWFARRKIWLGLLLAALVAAAFVLPSWYYGATPPPRSRTIFVAPVTTVERLFLIFGAFTAAVTEEVIFRGFALTRLQRMLGSPWLALPMTVISFLFIHGMPRNAVALMNYTLAGLAFGVPFILMGLRRLEILILLHFLIDASMVFAP